MTRNYSKLFLRLLYQLNGIANPWDLKAKGFTWKSSNRMVFPSSSWDLKLHLLCLLVPKINTQNAIVITNPFTWTSLHKRWQVTIPKPFLCPLYKIEWNCKRIEHFYIHMQRISQQMQLLLFKGDQWSVQFRTTAPILITITTHHYFPFKCHDCTFSCAKEKTP